MGHITRGLAAIALVLSYRSSRRERVDSGPIGEPSADGFGSAKLHVDMQPRARVLYL